MIVRGELSLISVCSITPLSRQEERFNDGVRHQCSPNVQICAEVSRGRHDILVEHLPYARISRYGQPSYVQNAENVKKNEN